MTTVISIARIFHDRSSVDLPRGRVYKALIGDNFEATTKTSIMNMGSIDQVRIGDFVTLLDDELTCYETGEIQIGHHVRMSLQGQMISGNRISIGNYCTFGRDVSIRDVDAPAMDRRARRQTNRVQGRWISPGRDSAPVTIGNDVWVGEGSIIRKGVSLGNGCVVAPGSVVTQSFPAFSLVAGNPAGFVRKVINIHAWKIQKVVFLDGVIFDRVEQTFMNTVQKNRPLRTQRPLRIFCSFLWFENSYDYRNIC